MAAGGGALIAASFLPWYGLGERTEAQLKRLELIAPGTSEGTELATTFNAWASFEVLDVIVVAAAATCIGIALRLIVSAEPRRRAELLSSAALAAAALATALIAFRIVSPPAEEASREYGVYLGLLAALVTLGGAALTFQRLTGSPPR